MVESKILNLLKLSDRKLVLSECPEPSTGNFLDLINKVNLNSDEQTTKIYKRALECWGNNLHKKNLDTSIPDENHHFNFRRVFGNEIEIYRGDFVLEIGVGAGIDIFNACKRHPSKNFIGLDLGINVSQLAHRDRNLNNVFYIRGDALSLPFENSTIDSIVSYGVFHHTPNPLLCMKEAFRVLKPGGQLLIYLYKDHEDNFFKWCGVKMEAALMLLTSKMSIGFGSAFCWVISPLILLTFSWPAQCLKKIKVTKKIGNSFPMHWGTTPSSIIGDLKDRLLASINFRFSKIEFENLFKNSGFSNIRTLTDTTGHYGVAEKIL